MFVFENTLRRDFTANSKQTRRIQRSITPQPCSILYSSLRFSVQNTKSELRKATIVDLAFAPHTLPAMFNRYKFNILDEPEVPEEKKPIGPIVEDDIQEEIKEAIAASPPKRVTKKIARSDKHMAMDILIDLEAEEIMSLREEFAKMDDALPLPDFVRVMKVRLPQKNHSEQEITLNLCELFAEIDFNGDGTVEWDEFTSFLIEAAMVQHFSLQKIKEYKQYKVLHDAALEENIKKVCYFPGWDKLVFCGRVKKTKIIDPNDLSTIRVLPDHEGAVLNAEYIPEFNQLVTSSADLSLRFWDAETFSCKQYKADSSQMALRWSPRFHSLYSASRSGDVAAWKTSNEGRDWKVVNVWPAHTDAVMDMIEIPRENLLATASLDSKILLYDLEKGEIKDRLIGHQKGVFSITYAPDYHFLISAGFEHDALVWIPNARTVPFRLHDPRKPHQHSLIGVYAVPNESQVITADTKGVFKIWDIRNFQCVQTFYCEQNLTKQQFNTFLMNSFVYMAPHQRIVTSGRKIYSFDYQKNANPTVADDLPVQSAMYNPTTISFMTASGTDIKLWDARKGCIDQIYSDISRSEITCMCLDERGRKFAIGNHSGDVQVFNYANGAFVKEFEGAHSSEVTSLTYCGKKHVMVSTSWDKTVKILSDREPAEGLILRELTGHTADVKCCSVSSALNLIISGGVDKTVFIWDFDSSKSLGNCTEFEGEVSALRFLHKFPAYVAGDSTGRLYLGTVRPYLHSSKVLVSWPNVRGRGLKHAITQIVFDKKSNYLYAADESGEITCWDLTHLIQTCKFERAQWPIRYTPEDIAAIKTFPQPTPSPTEAVFVRSWKAHSETVKSMQLIRDPPCLLTASSDCKVCLFTLDGEHSGGLRQSKTADEEEDEDDEEAGHYDFPVNMRKRFAEDAVRVAEVIRQINIQLKVIGMLKDNAGGGKDPRDRRRFGSGNGDNVFRLTETKDFRRGTRLFSDKLQLASMFAKQLSDKLQLLRDLTVSKGGPPVAGFYSGRDAPGRNQQSAAAIAARLGSEKAAASPLNKFASLSLDGAGPSSSS